MLTIVPSEYWLYILFLATKTSATNYDTLYLNLIFTIVEPPILKISFV